MVYHEPVDQILQGFYCQSSGFDKKFTIEAFVQPLYVPVDNLVLSLGKRLGGGSKRWDPSAGEEVIANGILGEIHSTGLPVLDLGSDPATLIQNIGYFVDQPESATVLETVAYSHIVINQAQVATPKLRELVARLAPKDAGSGWIHEMRQRAELLVEQLREDPEQARATLELWRERTCRSVGVC